MAHGGARHTEPAVSFPASDAGLTRYSALSVTIGSTRLARAAGTSDASPATSRRTPALTPKVAGSLGLTPAS